MGIPGSRQNLQKCTPSLRAGTHPNLFAASGKWLWLWDFHDFIIERHSAYPLATPADHLRPPMTGGTVASPLPIANLLAAALPQIEFTGVNF